MSFTDYNRYITAKGGLNMRAKRTKLRIGDTLYMIQHSRSEFAKETVEEKLIKLIANELDQQKNHHQFNES